MKFIQKILALTIILFTALSASGQRPQNGTLSGTVVTTDGEPAPYVNVNLKNTYYGTSTNSRGEFRLEAPAGPYTLQVFSITAHMKEISVRIVAGNDLPLGPIQIIEDVKSMEQVVVTGQFSPQSMRNSVYKVRVIGSEQINHKSANDVQSLLNTELGVRLSNDMALGETDFELMGMSGNNIKVLLDGVPFIDRGGPNKQSLSQIDVNSIERVEIVEGPMSVVYGTDALAGVINIITRKSNPEEGKNKFTVSAGIQEESAGTEYSPFAGKGIHRENIQAGWSGKSGAHVSAGATRYSSGGWRGDREGRELTWQPKDQMIFNATAGYKRKGIDVWYRFDFLDEELVTPANGSAIHPEEVSDKKFLTKRYTHQMQADWSPGNRLKINAALSYQDYARDTRTIMANTDTGEKWLSDDASSQDNSTMQSFFARTTATWQALPTLTFQPGIEYLWSKGSGDRIHGEPSLDDLAVYLSAEWRPLRWLNVRPGIRSILNSGYNAPPVIPTLLTKFSLADQVDLRLSYAYGFRAPTLRELHFSFHDANHNIEGNPDLRAETSNNLSGGITWRILHGRKARLTTSLSGFYNLFHDRIENVLVDAGSNPATYSYGNIDNYRTAGGTLENNFQWKNFGASVGFSYIGRYNRLKEDSSYDDRNMSTYRWSPEINASITYRIEKSGTDISLFYKFTGKRDYYTVSGEEITLLGQDSYHWADLTIVQKVGKYVRISGGVKNIFDITMVRNTAGGGMGSTGTGALLGYGRSFFVGASFLL